MATLDRVREEIAYLKVWQGVAVISAISLGGWLVSAGDTASLVTYGLALSGALLLGFFSLILHRQIESRIRQTETL